MAYKRNHLLFVKADTDGTIAKAATYAADRFKGVVITDGDELTANFKSTDGTGDAALVKLHLDNGHGATACLEEFKNFCRALAGALAGHSLQPGTTVTVADDVNNKYLHGAGLANYHSVVDGATGGGVAVTEITL